ncbi:hypothetical protein L6452_40728 [Arctium lappa]|uniref:Uncharacterized protein n=1 Tax=Arctium lappa TaxID=4217 RepID=A0ACB8XN88_ARCLA|nr:hypothetical protein L6452_40728 [Arctium lappa]
MLTILSFDYRQILEWDVNRRLDYFRVTSFDVHGGNDLPGIANYGGGRGGGNSINGSTSAGGGDRIGQVAIGISANIGSSDGGGAEVVGPILDRETGSTGAGGGDTTGQIAVWVYANNGGNGGVVGRKEKVWSLE